MKLWSLTTVRLSKETDILGKSYEGTDIRCVGIYTRLPLARKAVVNNYGDIYEMGYYPYVVLEETHTDRLYPFGKVQYWYEWMGDCETGAYNPIEIPERFKNIVGWGIG